MIYSNQPMTCRMTLRFWKPAKNRIKPAKVKTLKERAAAPPFVEQRLYSP